ncbi:MAG: hypothetical protein CM15mP83_5160 [Flavobacteriaceae bacterium]|nr:MAG: hypothetical protein CM15mP83_5160 [Flavobacteriaceae bacterium]
MSSKNLHSRCFKTNFSDVLKSPALEIHGLRKPPVANWAKAQFVSTCFSSLRAERKKPHKFLPPFPFLSLHQRSKDQKNLSIFKEGLIEKMFLKKIMCYNLPKNTILI